MERFLLPLLVLLPLAALAATPPTSPSTPLQGDTNDYPTAARADYVFACMTVNGGTQEALRRCSCSIDVIASLLPYADYEKADTVLRMRQLTGGYLAQTFRVPQTNAYVRHLQEAQAEAEVRCF